MRVSIPLAQCHSYWLLNQVACKQKTRVYLKISKNEKQTRLQSKPALRRVTHGNRNVAPLQTYPTVLFSVLQNFQITLHGQVCFRYNLEYAWSWYIRKKLLRVSIVSLFVDRGGENRHKSSLQFRKGLNSPWDSSNDSNAFYCEKQHPNVQL